MINLTDLKRLLAEMTPRPWAQDPDGFLLRGDIGHKDGATFIAELSGETMGQDGPGIIALVNAAPVLVEIVDAVLAKEQAEAEAEQARDAWRQASRERSTAESTLYVALDLAEHRASDAIGRLRSALAKVTR